MLRISHLEGEVELWWAVDEQVLVEEFLLV